MHIKEELTAPQDHLGVEKDKQLHINCPRGLWFLVQGNNKNDDLRPLEQRLNTATVFSIQVTFQTPQD